MLYVVYSDGQIEELPEATAIAKEEGTLICADAEGRVVREYDRHTVLMFGYDEKIKRYAAMARDAASEGPA